ncbi:hypothetical protein [Catenuloplanes atrovinosus]|uniref:Uncharacterized protein n=1 Tax=Catenuloplanes atrovinosus TaxID=137266 RepID=A0AAE3YMZ8_9ACTN|nr:hypothetical protein [Catenuloplanes atrovinosus]MDR7276052.1 hypothetical protein [Catenuloplanes atrovinosus]
MSGDLRRVRELAAAGDGRALAAELVGLAVRNGDVWRQDAAAVRAVVWRLSPARRHALILDVAELAPVHEVVGLLGWLGYGLEADALSWRAGLILIEAASARMTAFVDDLAVLARVAVRETGVVPPGLVAVMRRTERWLGRGGTSLRPWLASVAEPLNAGEVWAEAANAECPDRRLLGAALEVSGPRPGVGWSRRVAVLADEWGVVGCRRLVHRWCGLVPAGRTIVLRRAADEPDWNGVLDPYNARALRGLLFVLTVLPVDEGDVPVAGGLGEFAARKVPGHGPRSQVVAYAAVRALESFGSVAALRELERLRALGLARGVAGRLDAAIMRRRAARG